MCGRSTSRTRRRTGSPASVPAAWRGSAPTRPTVDRHAILGPGGAERVHAIEYGWLEAMQATELYAYRFDADRFRPFGAAAPARVRGHRAGRAARTGRARGRPARPPRGGWHRAARDAEPVAVLGRRRGEHARVQRHPPRQRTIARPPWRDGISPLRRGVTPLSESSSRRATTAVPRRRRQQLADMLRRVARHRRHRLRPRRAGLVARAVPAGCRSRGHDRHQGRRAARDVASRVDAESGPTLLAGIGRRGRRGTRRPRPTERRSVRRCPASATSLESGTVSAGHVDAIVTVPDHSTTPATGARGIAESLVNAAATVLRAFDRVVKDLAKRSTAMTAWRQESARRSAPSARVDKHTGMHKTLIVARPRRPTARCGRRSTRRRHAGPRSRTTTARSTNCGPTPSVTDHKGRCRLRPRRTYRRSGPRRLTRLATASRALVARDIGLAFRRQPRPSTASDDANFLPIVLGAR